jgi:hemerythrin-like metal-binding protein
MNGFFVDRSIGMIMFPWDDKYKTNHQTIDSEHRRLIDLMNELAEAMVAAKGRFICESVLNELVNYTKTHFANEERLMTIHNYAMTSQHKAMHAFFIQKVGDFKVRFDSGDLAVTASMLYFLRDWLIQHIQESDKALVAAIGAELTKGVRDI